MGTFLVVLAGICWGVISIFINKLDGAGLDSFDIMSIRTWGSALVMLLVLIIMDRKKLVIRLKDIWMFIGTGLLSLTFFSYCYFTSIVEIGTAISVVLLYTSPIFVMIMSLIFFKEKMSAIKMLALVLTMTGCILVTGVAGGTDSRISAHGILLGLGAGFGYALYSIFAGFALKKYSSLTITFYTFVMSGVALVFMRNPVRIFNQINFSDSSMWVYCLGLIIIATVIPYVTYTIGMSKMEVGRAAVLVTVEPIVGCLLGILAWGESAGVSKIIGIVLVLMAVVILAIPSKKA